MINRTRNRLLAGIVVGAAVIILLNRDGEPSYNLFQVAGIFIVALLITYISFWVVDRYHLF